jgi:diacylglycerol kinase family enzyme
MAKNNTTKAGAKRMTGRKLWGGKLLRFEIGQQSPFKKMNPVRDVLLG